MKYLLSVLVLLLTQMSFAGGTLSKEEALKLVCAEDISKCELLKRLPLGPVAAAMRDREGYRLIPVEFLTEDGKNLVRVERIEGSFALKITVEDNQDY